MAELSEVIIPDGWESASDAVAHAAKHGIRLTASRLHRFHREALIGRPVQRGAGRGRGSLSFYRPGTGQQIVAADHFMKMQRDVDAVRWRLWREGFDIDTETIRSQILASIAEFEKKISKYIKGDALAPTAIDMLRKRATRRRRKINNFVPGIRGELLVNALVVYLEIFAGLLGKWEKSAVAAPAGAIGEILIACGAPPSIRDELEKPETFQVFKALSFISATEVVRDAPPRHLEYARDKLYTIWQWFLTAVVDRIHPSGAPHDMDDASVEEQMVCFGLAMSLANAATRQACGDSLEQFVSYSSPMRAG